MTRMSGGRAAVEALQANGVDTVFGLIGSATMEIFDALYDAKDIRFIGVRDERSGTHMADGYARASGKAGVFLAGQNGPGATNLVTAIAQAQAAYSPVIALAGSLATGHVYRDAFQEVDQQQLFTPITKKTYMVNSAGRVPSARMTSASRARCEATSLPRGPTWPAFRGWSNGIPSPCPGEVATGTLRDSASSITASWALLFFIPPPAMISGRLAATRSFAAFATCSALARMAVWALFSIAPRIAPNSASAANTSRGRLRSTGPWRGDSALRKPSLMSSGTRPALLTI